MTNQKLIEITKAMSMIYAVLTAVLLIMVAFAYGYIHYPDITIIIAALFSIYIAYAYGSST